MGKFGSNVSWAKKLRLYYWIKHRKDLHILCLFFTLYLELAKKPKLADRKYVISAFWWLSQTAGTQCLEIKGLPSLMHEDSFFWAYPLAERGAVPSGVSLAGRAHPPEPQQMGCAGDLGSTRLWGKFCLPCSLLGLYIAGYTSNKTAEFCYLYLRELRIFFNDLICRQNAYSLSFSI